MCAGGCVVGKVSYMDDLLSSQCKTVFIVRVYVKDTCKEDREKEERKGDLRSPYRSPMARDPNTLHLSVPVPVDTRHESTPFLGTLLGGGEKIVSLFSTDKRSEGGVLSFSEGCVPWVETCRSGGLSSGVDSHGRERKEGGVRRWVTLFGLTRELKIRSKKPEYETKLEVFCFYN